MSIAAIKLEFTPLQGEELLKWIPDFKADGRLTDPIKKEKDIKDKEESERKGRPAFRRIPIHVSTIDDVKSYLL